MTAMQREDSQTSLATFERSEYPRGTDAVRFCETHSQWCPHVMLDDGRYRCLGNFTRVGEWARSDA